MKLLYWYLGQTQNEMIDSMHRIGEEVIPHFKEESSCLATND